MPIEKQIFGKMDTGETVDAYTLINKNGCFAKIITFGGILISLNVPDQEGELDDVVLGFHELDNYLIESSPYFGAIVGRYANRIGNASFRLDGKTYELPANHGKHHLHGGLQGFDKVIWSATPLDMKNGPLLRLTYQSADGEEEYPGNLDVVVDYQLTHDNELRIEYQAETDKATPINLTHHAYFNLTGPASRSILEHEILINAERLTRVDDQAIPTGEIVGVRKTPFDFTRPKRIGQHIDEVAPGYDHNYVLSGKEELHLAARVTDPASRRMMDVYTTLPGLQFYTGNFLQGILPGKGGRPYGKHAGFCLETQFFPDSPNQPHFPDCVLRPGEVYRHETVFRFGVM